MKAKEVLMTFFKLKRRVENFTSTWSEANSTALTIKMRSHSLFHVLKLQRKTFSHGTLRQHIKGWASSAETKQITPQQREGEEKLETTRFEYPRSLGKCGDLFRISVRVEGRRMNENQQTRWIRDLNDWLKCNLAWKYSPRLFPHEFNPKVIFASFIAASAGYLMPSASPL